MKSKKVKMVSVLLLIVCLMCLSGCKGMREVEELSPIIGIGIDLGEKPGTYLITYQLIAPQKGGESGVSVKSRVIGVEASTGREAHEKISKITSRMPFMGSLKVIVLGEDVAKAGFIQRLDFEQRFPEFRRTLYLVVTKGKAENLLNMELAADEIPSIYIKRVLEKGDAISVQPVINLGQFLKALSENSEVPIIPLVQRIEQGDEGIVFKAKEEEVEELQFEGAGVFREDRLVDFLTDRETKGYMWLEDKVKLRLINTMSSEDSQVVFGGQVLQSSTKHKVTDQNGQITMQYRIKAIMQVDEVAGLTKRLSETEWAELIKEAEKSFAQEIRQECELSIQKEKKLGLDFLSIGRHIDQQKPAYWKAVKDQWEQKIADLPVSVDVQVKIEHTGMSSSSVVTKPIAEGEE
jgi:spore germination protein KC